MFKFKLILLGLVLYCLVLIKCNDSYCLNHVSCFDSKGEEDFVAPCLRNIAPDTIGSFCETTVLSSYYAYDQCIPTNCLASVKNYCSSHPCQNSGLCFPMFGSYSCQCQTKFHGRNCEHRLEEDTNFMHDVYFIFNKFTTTKKKNLLYIFFREPGDDMRMIFSAGDSGEVFEINELQMKAVANGHAQCIKRKLKEHQCRYIPNEPMLYKSIHFEVVFSLEGTILMEYYPKNDIPVPGFKVNQLSVTIFNKQYQQFSGEFNQLVSYRKEICPVQVVITENCGSRSDKPLQIKRNDDRIIVSSLKKYKLTTDECLNQIIDYKWTVFEIRRRLLTHVLLPEKTTTGVDEYKIDKFTFPIGLYKVKLTVFLSGIKHTEEYSTFYSGLCFFEVLKVPLKVEIRGGASRTVQPFEPFSLDGSASYDPNEPHDNQLHLIWKWNCDGTEEFCKDHLTENGIYQFQGGLPAGIWTFTLTLKTIDESNIPVAASQTIYSLNFQTQIEINCLKNCGIGGFKTNTKEIVYLEANVLNNEEEVELLWTVSHESDEFNAAEIAEASVKSNILIIKENVLEADSEYTFKVKPSNILLNGVSSITITTNKEPDGGTCAVSPQEGIMADTTFHIACVNFTVHGDELSQLRYEFYQGDLEQEQPGIMFGHSISGELKNVLLTKQRIIVRIVDEYGMYKEVSLNVNLHERQPSTLDIEKYLRILTMEKQFGDSGSRAIIAGVVLDVMANVPDKLRVIKLLLESLSKERTNSFTDIKMYTSVLRKIVKVGVYQVVDGIDSSVVQSMGALMLSITKSMLNITSSIDKNEAVIIFDDIKSITLTMLSCSDVIVNSKDETIFDSSSSNRATFSVHERYKKGTSSMIEALHLSGKAILASLLPHEKEVVLKGKDTTMWLKVENPEILSNISEIPQLSTTNIRIKKGLAKLLQGRSENIAAKVVLFNKNPFWWDLKENEISSEIVSVTFWERSEMNKLITDVPDPLDIFFKLNNTKYEIISGTIFNDILSANNDSLVAVHVFEATPENSNGKLFVEFIDLESNELRVMLSENFRPDYDSMINDSHIVSAKHSRLSLSYENISANTLHFIGILPGANSLVNQTVSYTFKVYIAECKLRYPTMWISTACKIGEETSEDYVHCRCSHLSFFGSGIFVSPNRVNPIQDLSLFMTLDDNPLVFVIVVSLLLIYLALLILVHVKEKRNRLKGRVIVLEDNIPGDLFCYLLVVHTSFNIGSGTSSNVGIRLHGSGSKQSRPHILRSGVRQVLRRSADDWFLLFTKEHLGDLEKIEMWHDNTGPHPDWCCKKILVYDVTTKDQYTFMVEKWFSVRPGESLTAEIFPLESAEHSDWKKTITHNFVHHFQENHLWASILLSHPRAIIPKTQRLTIAFCILFSTLLTGIMFYGVTGHIQEDDPIYSISLREIVLIIECTVISDFTSRLVEFCFAKSKSLIQDSDLVTEQFPKDRNTFNLVCKNMLYALSYIRKATKNMIRGKPLIPILVGKDTHTTVVRRGCWKKAGWILSQAIIWISAYFIILYGLKLGKVRGELWITSTAFSITKSVFVTQPLKLIIFSVILGTLFKEEYTVDDCESDFDAVIKRRSFADKLIFSDLKWVNYSSEYCPLSKIKTADYQKSYLKKIKLSNIFQSIVTVLLLLMLMYLTTQRWVGANHWNNSHMSISLSRSLRSHESSLEEVDSEMELIGYLITNWIPNIFKGRWYNRRVNLTSTDESFQESGWFVDANHRLVGMPRLRQIRVIHERCSFFLFNKMNKSSYCFPAMKDSKFDTGSYGLEWNKLDNYVNKPFLVPWTFRPESDGLMVYGQSGTAYPGGGYVALLKNTQRACASMISDLRDLHWWDCHTRALISEFSLYNPNTKSLTTVITITEHLPSGAFTNRIQTHTVQMDFNLFFGSFLFLCIITCIAVNLGFNVNHQGLFGVFKNIWTCYDLVLILLSSVCMTFEWLTVFQYAKNVRSFMKGNNGFFHYSKTVLYERILQVLWCLLLGLAPIRILRLKLIANFCKISFYTLYRKKGVLTIVSAVIICLILAQIKIINFAISPEIKPFYESKFIMREGEMIHEGNSMHNQSISSHMLALVCIIATMIIKIILIKTYTIQKHSREA